MISRDRNEKERLDSRNALEEYVYDLREKLDGDLSGFVEDSEKQKLSETLSSLENWLYEDGSDEKKEVYVEKLQDLKVIIKGFCKHDFLVILISSNTIILFLNRVKESPSRNVAWNLKTDLVPWRKWKSPNSSPVK